MEPVIATLVSEHRLAAQYWALLRKATSEHKEIIALSEYFSTIGKFLVEFLDKVHHVKEENILYHAMLEAGIPKDHPSLSFLLEEHTEARKYVQDIIHGDPFTRDLAIRKYLKLMGPHTKKEETLMFPVYI